MVASSDWFRRVLGQHPTGVVIVTAIGLDGAPVGLTVGSFTSVSLEPPLVAFLPAKSSTSWPKIRAAEKFCVNILSAEQEQTCRLFAASGTDKFAGLTWRPAGSGSPILADVAAWIDCDLFAVHEAGDHDIVIGKVRDLDVENAVPPLVFYQGGYGRFVPLSLAARDADLAAPLALIDEVRLDMEALAERARGQVLAWHLVGSEVVLVAGAGVPSVGPALAARIGQRLPAEPPVAMLQFAFADPETVERWLTPIESDELRESYRQRLAKIRERGYSVGLAAPGRFETEAIMERRRFSQIAPPLSDDERRRMQELPLDPVDFSLDAAENLHSIQFPAFGPNGEIVLTVILIGFARPETPSEGRALVDEVRQLAAAVTRKAGGTPPP